MAGLALTLLFIAVFIALFGSVFIPLVSREGLAADRRRAELLERRRKAWLTVAEAMGLQVDRADRPTVLHGRIDGRPVVVEAQHQPVRRTEVRVGRQASPPVETLVLAEQLREPRTHPLEVRGELSPLLGLLDVGTRRQLAGLALRGRPTVASHDGDLRLAVPGEVQDPVLLERLIATAVALYARIELDPDGSVRELLAVDPEEPVRIAAATVLARRLTPANRAALETATAQRGQVRLAAATALGEPAPLVALVSDEDEPLERRLEGLRRAVPLGAFSAALTAALGSSHHEVRRHALLAARERPEEVTLAALAQLETRLADPASTLAPALRGVEGTLLATLLAERSGEEAEAIALRLARWPDTGVQRAAIDTLGHIGGREALPLLDLLEGAVQPASTRRLVRQVQLRIQHRLREAGAEAGAVSLSLPTEEAGALSLARPTAQRQDDKSP